ncbi:hypothetical protein Leryth_025873 [Lithospermum erythrorhizon]|nr:hypothetical protein Leryth_025873 [Lithospermum erythrorhizon]
MASECEGKSSWPELVGTEGNYAKQVIERENCLVTAVLVPEGSSVTLDFRCDRVRVWVNQNNIVTRAPFIG